MYKILGETAFSFTFELQNDTCYRLENPYSIYINGKHYKDTANNIASVFGLEPDTTYDVSLQGKDVDISFEVTTLLPTYIINVKECNATGDGIANDTAAINMAIYTAPPQAIIHIPPGEYLCDHIFLKSDIEIYLEKGATIKQNTDRSSLAVAVGYKKNYDHTDATVNASWEGHPLDCYGALIYGKDVENVFVFGEGTIDGNGDISGFWDNPKGRDVAYRPRNIFLNRCANISFTGITSRNSASWNIHPYYCESIYFTDMKIESIATSPNTDGLNPESCELVHILGCHFSVGDDCIAIKSGKYFMSNTRFNPELYHIYTRDVTIRNCFMEAGHGAVVIGSEIACGVRNVHVSQCLFKDTDRGLRIKTRRGRGARSVVDNITFDNITMDGVKHGFVINMFYNCDPDGNSLYVSDKTVTKKDKYTPTVKNITLTNINATNIKGAAIFMYGLPENKIKNVTITNCNFNFAKNRTTEPPAMMQTPPPVDATGIYINNAEHKIN